MNDFPHGDSAHRSPRLSLALAASYLVALALLAGLLAASAACAEPPVQAPPSTGTLLDESKDDIIEAFGFVVDRITTATLRHRIVAERAIHNATQQFAEMHNLTIEFYDADGLVVDGKLWAMRGVLYLNDRPTSDALKNDVDLFGTPDFPVQFRRADEGSTERGDTLLTPRLRWNDAEVWGETIGVIRGTGPYRQIRFQEDGSILLFESDDPDGYIKTDRALGRVGFHKSEIKSINLTEEELLAIRPDPSPDAPVYVARD
jgi:hypothetical protein